MRRRGLAVEEEAVLPTLLADLAGIQPDEVTAGGRLLDALALQGR